MSRNFDRRIELLFEVTRQDLNEHLRFILEEYWLDNLKSHLLNPGGAYSRSKPEDKAFNAQEYFIEHYAK